MTRTLARATLIAAVAGSSCPAWGQSKPPNGPDVTYCQVYGLSAFGRVGAYPNGVSGLSLAETAWNIGTESMLWEQNPSSRHPFKALDVYHLDVFTIGGIQVDRIRHIGQSWAVHEFFALSNTQCGPHPYTGAGCAGTNGSRLGIGCTTTSSASINGDQSNSGPRYEINPWTGGWSYAGSTFQVGGPSNTPIRRRIQVQDQDLIAALDTRDRLIAQAYMVASDDVNAMNSAGWKLLNSHTWNGSNWTFAMTGPTGFVNRGFAIDAWTGARQTLIAQELPIIEHWTAANTPGGFQPSPDGRAVLASKVFDLGGGWWRYEYALLNVDMDRQIGSFSIDVPAGVLVKNVGFHAVRHHDEPANAIGGKPIDNSPWKSQQTGTFLTWSTAPYEPQNVPSNPLRWGTLYNFWFTANAAPGETMATLGLFKPGTPDSVQGATNGPMILSTAPTLPIYRQGVEDIAPASAQSPCSGDANGDGAVDFADLTAILAAFGTLDVRAPGRGDSNYDGVVDFHDITTTLMNFGSVCAVR